MIELEVALIEAAAAWPSYLFEQSSLMFPGVQRKVLVRFFSPIGEKGVRIALEAVGRMFSSTRPPVTAHDFMRTLLRMHSSTTGGA